MTLLMLAGFFDLICSVKPFKLLNLTIHSRLVGSFLWIAFVYIMF